MAIRWHTLPVPSGRGRQGVTSRGCLCRLSGKKSHSTVWIPPARWTTFQVRGKYMTNSWKIKHFCAPDIYSYSRSGNRSEQRHNYGSIITREWRCESHVATTPAVTRSQRNYCASRPPLRIKQRKIFPSTCVIGEPPPAQRWTELRVLETPSPLNTTPFNNGKSK